MGQQPAAAAMPTVLAIALELGYLTPAQAQEALDLQKMIAKGKLQISLEQILLQRRYVAPAQFKTLMDELDLRRARQNAHDMATHGMHGLSRVQHIATSLLQEAGAHGTVSRK
jgi:phage tail tape-measure protein